MTILDNCSTAPDSATNPTGTFGVRTPPSPVGLDADGSAFAVCTSDGRVLDMRDFLDLPEEGTPVPSAALPAREPIESRPKRRYARMIARMRAKFAAKDASGAQASDAQTSGEQATDVQTSSERAPDVQAPDDQAQDAQPQDAQPQDSRDAQAKIAPSANAQSADTQSGPTRDSQRTPSKPRANKGNATEADELRQDDLAAAVDGFAAAYRARGPQEAAMIRALSTAYDIAAERASAAFSRSAAEPGSASQNAADARLDENTRLAFESQASGEEMRMFSWYFTSVLGEFAIATNDSDKYLRNRGFDANLLVTLFPNWVTALDEGRTDMRYVQALLTNSRNLSDEQCAEYGALVLEFALTNTPGQTAAFAEEAAATIAAEEFEAAQKRARDQRCVTIRNDGLGMATLKAYLPSELATPIAQLLDKGARELIALNRSNEAEYRESLREARRIGVPEPAEYVPDSRTIGQIRADIFAETLLCSTPGESRVKAVISVTIPALSVLEGRVDGTQPALLEGQRPMSFDEARQLASEVPSFQRVLTDPLTGQVLAVDTHEPSRALRRYLQVRDQICRFPGCSRPAVMSEADHTHPYSEGGATSAENMAHLCVGHHTQKHERPWAVTNLGGGVLEWRTPLGQVVTTRPKPQGPVFVPTWEYGPPPF